MTSPVHTVANTWETNRDILSNKTNAWKNKADNPVISSYTYTVTPLGQRTAVATAGEAFAQSPANWVWTYDVLGQVIQANTDHYAYDKIGNRRTSGKNNEVLTTYTANALNQYTAINTALPTYDADGNQLTGLTSTASHPSRASLAFTYNANSRLIEIRQNGDRKEFRTYDHQGRRIRKGETITLYEDFNAIAEYNLSTHVLKTTYAWGLDLIQGAGGVGGLLCVTEHDKQTPLTSYPCYDGNGNITEYLTEGNGGTVAAHYEYDAFGNVIKNTGEKEYSYQFSTKPYDVLTGLNYYNYRDYEPISGRWINRDPIQENGGVNLYCFNTNNAICFFDILGNITSIHGAIAQGIAQGLSIPQIASALGLSVSEVLTLAQSAAVAAELAKLSIEALEELKKECNELADIVKEAKDNVNLIGCHECDSQIDLASKTLAWLSLAEARWDQNLKCFAFLKDPQKEVETHIKKQQEANKNYEKCLEIMNKL